MTVYHAKTDPDLPTCLRQVSEVDPEIRTGG